MEEQLIEGDAMDIINVLRMANRPSPTKRKFAYIAKDSSIVKIIATTIIVAIEAENLLSRYCKPRFVLLAGCTYDPVKNILLTVSGNQVDFIAGKLPVDELSSYVWVATPRGSTKL